MDIERLLLRLKEVVGDLWEPQRDSTRAEGLHARDLPHLNRGEQRLPHHDCSGRARLPELDRFSDAHRNGLARNLSKRELREKPFCSRSQQIHVRDGEVCRDLQDRLS